MTTMIQTNGPDSLKRALAMKNGKLGLVKAVAISTCFRLALGETITKKQFKASLDNDARRYSDLVTRGDRSSHCLFTEVS